MNVTLYNQELDLARWHYRRPQPHEVRGIVESYEIRLMDQVADLLAAGVLKMGASPRALAYLRNGVVEALQVLGAVLVAEAAAACGSVEQKLQGADERFNRKLDEMRDLSLRKNNDYSPFNIFKSGNLGLATRMGDKISRIHNAVVQGTELRVPSENIVETSLDLVNYAVYQVMVAMDAWVTEEQRRKFLDYLIEAKADRMCPLYIGVGDAMVRVTETPGAVLWKAP